MSEHEQELDATLARAITELRREPPARPDAVARAVEAARAASTVPEALAPASMARRRRRRTILAVAGIAAAACVAGYAARGMLEPGERAAPAAAGSASNGLVVQAANAGDDPAHLTWQFVFQSSRAHRVSLIGDFNGWDPTAAPLTRAAGSGLWSVTLPLTPGRHTYAFLVDDSSFVLDPRAPATRDADLGSKESVVIVGRP